MSIIPGAGDYLVWFSGSIESNGSSDMQYVALTRGGTEISHTVRNAYTEESIPNTPFPIATHAYISGVGASETIGVSWKTDATATATMHERTLVVTKVNASDVDQATATGDTTTTSDTDTPLNSMSIIPGAGDYLVWFSGSMESGDPGNSWQYISVYMNGVQEAHTERRMYTEYSIRNTSFPVGTHAKITGVGAGEAIEVQWRTSAGTATMHQRTLVVYKINASDATQVSETTDTTTTSDTDVLLDSMTIPVNAGNYHIWFSEHSICLHLPQRQQDRLHRTSNKAGRIPRGYSI
jgi:hypothetical protein